MFKLGLLGVITVLAAYIYTSYDGVNNHPELLQDIKIYQKLPTVESNLQKFKSVIGKDYKGYEGHIYRVLSYSIHFLGGDEKYLDVIASALVFHDIGLWTDGTLAYLEPSCSQASNYYGNAFSSEENELIQNIIYWHHKITPFHGNHSDVVNAVIKADMIDASVGIITKGMPRAHIEKVTKTIPNAGFHQTLAEFGPRLHGWNIYRIVTDLSSILKF